MPGPRAVTPMKFVCVWVKIISLLLGMLILIYVLIEDLMRVFG